MQLRGERQIFVNYKGMNYNIKEYLTEDKVPPTPEWLLYPQWKCISSLIVIDEV